MVPEKAAPPEFFRAAEQEFSTTEVSIAIVAQAPEKVFTWEKGNKLLLWTQSADSSGAGDPPDRWSAQRVSTWPNPADMPDYCSSSMTFESRTEAGQRL